MRATEFITERKSAPLYHGTPLRSAENILKTDEFDSSSGSRSEYGDWAMPGGSTSFTRDLKTATGFFGLSDIGVILVMDQARLREVYGNKLKPHNDGDFSHPVGHPFYRYARDFPAQGGSEFEELLLGKIRNANYFIKKIIVLAPNRLLDDLDVLKKKYPHIGNDKRTHIVSREELGAHSNPMKLKQLVGETEFITDDLDPFHSDTTEMPFYDDLLTALRTNDTRLLNYFDKEKGLKPELVSMTPMEYINKVAAGFNSTTKKVMGERDPELVDSYAQKMQSGETFPILTLDYSRGPRVSQEGIHRSMAAIKVGIEEVPVLVIRSTD